MHGICVTWAPGHVETGWDWIRKEASVYALMDFIVSNSYPHSGMQVLVKLLNKVHTMILPVFLSITWEPVSCTSLLKSSCIKKILGKIGWDQVFPSPTSLHVDVFRFSFIHFRYIIYKKWSPITRAILWVGAPSALIEVNMQSIVL